MAQITARKLWCTCAQELRVCQIREVGIAINEHVRSQLFLTETNERYVERRFVFGTGHHWILTRSRLIVSSSNFPFRLLASWITAIISEFSDRRASTWSARVDGFHGNILEKSYGESHEIRISREVKIRRGIYVSEILASLDWFSTV